MACGSVHIINCSNSNHSAVSDISQQLEKTNFLSGNHNLDVDLMLFDKRSVLWARNTLCQWGSSQVYKSKMCRSRALAEFSNRTEELIKLKFVLKFLVCFNLQVNSSTSHTEIRWIRKPYLLCCFTVWGMTDLFLAWGWKRGDMQLSSHAHAVWEF